MLHRLQNLTVTGALAVLLSFGTALAQSSGAGEYEIKAAFLFNFARFAEWSPAAFADPTKPLVIGIIGPDPFDSHVLEALASKNIHGRSVAIRHFKDARDIEVCHVLFIGSVKEKDMRGILNALKGRSILTVGDSPGFIAAGGMIRFSFQNEKVHFDVNLPVVESASVRLSAKLLEIATIVRQ